MSDFRPPAEGAVEQPEGNPGPQGTEDTSRDTGPVKRLYAVPRGRKADQRDERDLLVAYKAGVLRELLLSQDMVEEVILC